MSNIMQDKYNLGQSVSGVITNIGNEINLNLSLSLNSNNMTGLKIYGTVKDENNNLIENATVKLMSSDYHPLFHAKTNASGEYSFYDLPRNNTYNVFVTSKGYMLEQNTVSSFLGTKNLEIDFVLQEDSDLNLGLISGIVVNAITNQPKANVVVKLINTSNGSQVLQAISYTNENGQFIFSNVSMGTYLINASALGYNSLNLETSIINPGQLVSLTAGITQKANISKGIISGQIQDCSNNNFLEGADVILYEVQSDNSLNPVAFTKTIKDGYYMFGNVPIGTYKIKSNELQATTVNFPNPFNYSPYFYSFTILSSDGSFSNTYYAKDAVLYGAAFLYNRFIQNVGSLLGYLILPNVTVPSNGTYNLIIKYVADNNTRVSNIAVNNLPTGDLYAFPSTGSLLLSSVNDKVISLNLIQGQNIIEIYNE